MTRYPQTIDHYMSSVLVTVEPGWPLREALRLMREHEFRHLPVVSKGRVVGVVSLSAAETASAKPAARASGSASIADAMNPRPYVVDPEESAARVARGMAKRRVDCAIVAHDECLVGVFTATDALLALAALLDDERIPDVETKVLAPSSGKNRAKAKPASGARKATLKPRVRVPSSKP